MLFPGLDSTTYFTQDKYREELDLINFKVVRLYHEAIEIIENATEENSNISVEKIKDFLCLFEDDLDAELENATSVGEVAKKVRRRSPLNDCKYLDALAERFELCKLQKLVNDFKDRARAFCEKVKATHKYARDFLNDVQSSESSSTRNTAILIVKWESASLALINSLLKKAFSEEAVRVTLRVVEDGPIIAMCEFSMTYTEVLTMIAVRNRNHLLAMDVTYLQVDQFIVINQVNKFNFCQSLSSGLFL